MDADGTERKTSFGYMYIKHEKLSLAIVSTIGYLLFCQLIGE